MMGLFKEVTEEELSELLKKLQEVYDKSVELIPVVEKKRRITKREELLRGKTTSYDSESYQWKKVEDSLRGLTDNLENLAQEMVKRMKKMKGK